MRRQCANVKIYDMKIIFVKFQHSDRTRSNLRGLSYPFLNQFNDSALCQQTIGVESLGTHRQHFNKYQETA